MGVDPYCGGAKHLVTGREPVTVIIISAFLGWIYTIYIVRSKGGEKK